MSEKEPPLPVLAWQPVEAGCQPEFEPHREEAYLSNLCLSTDASGFWHVTGCHRGYSHDVWGQTASRDEAREDATRAAMAVLANLPAGARSLKALRESEVCVRWQCQMPDEIGKGRWVAEVGPFRLEMVASSDMQWTWTVRQDGLTPTWTGYAYSELAAFRGADIYLRKAIEAAGMTASGPYAGYYDVLCRAIRDAKLPLNVTAREQASVADVITDARRRALNAGMPDDLPF